MDTLLRPRLLAKLWAARDELVPPLGERALPLRVRRSLGRLPALVVVPVEEPGAFEAACRLLAGGEASGLLPVVACRGVELGAPGCLEAAVAYLRRAARQRFGAKVHGALVLASPRLTRALLLEGVAPCLACRLTGLALRLALARDVGVRCLAPSGGTLGAAAVELAARLGVRTVEAPAGPAPEVPPPPPAAARRTECVLARACPPEPPGTLPDGLVPALGAWLARRLAGEDVGVDDAGGVRG